MRRFIYLLLAAALTCGTAYLYFKSAVRSAGARDKSTPRATLDRASSAARDIERSTQSRIDDLAKKTE